MKSCPLCDGRILVLKRDDHLVLICQNYDGIEAHYGEIVVQKKEEKCIAAGA